MHELSIALSIVDVATEELARHGGTRVASVRLRLGPLSGVIREALCSAWELATDHTPLAGSRLDVEDVPIVVYCPTCQAERPARSLQEICCATCGTPTPQVVSGREMEVRAMEIVIDDDETGDRCTAGPK